MAGDSFKMTDEDCVDPEAWGGDDCEGVTRGGLVGISYCGGEGSGPCCRARSGRETNIVANVSRAFKAARARKRWKSSEISSNNISQALRVVCPTTTVGTVPWSK